MHTNLQIEFMDSVQGQDYQIVKFDGEFDKAGYAEVKERLDKFVEGFSLKTMIFDLTNLKYINSEGIGYLIEVHTHLVQRGGKLVLIGPGANVKDIFATIGITEIVSIYGNINDFLSNK